MFDFLSLMLDDLLQSGGVTMQDALTGPETKQGGFGSVSIRFVHLTVIALPAIARNNFATAVVMAFLYGGSLLNWDFQCFSHTGFASGRLKREHH